MCLIRSTCHQILTETLHLLVISSQVFTQTATGRFIKEDLKPVSKDANDAGGGRLVGTFR